MPVKMLLLFPNLS